MKIEVNRSAVISFMFCDVVVDDFWRLKNHLHIDSPVNLSRLDYWLAIEELFDWLPPRDVTYWKHPPTLELPERAASLEHQRHWNAILVRREHTIRACQ